MTATPNPPPNSSTSLLTEVSDKIMEAQAGLMEAIKYLATRPKSAKRFLDGALQELVSAQRILGVA